MGRHDFYFTRPVGDSDRKYGSWSDSSFFDFRAFPADSICALGFGGASICVSRRVYVSPIGWDYDQYDELVCFYFGPRDCCR